MAPTNPNRRQTNLNRRQTNSTRRPTNRNRRQTNRNQSIRSALRGKDGPRKSITSRGKARVRFSCPRPRGTFKVGETSSPEDDVIKSFDLLNIQSTKRDPNQPAMSTTTTSPSKGTAMRPEFQPLQRESWSSGSSLQVYCSGDEEDEDMTTRPDSPYPPRGEPLGKSLRVCYFKDENLTIRPGFDRIEEEIVVL